MTLCARDSRLQDFNGAMQNEEHAGNASLDHFSSWPARRLLECSEDQSSVEMRHNPYLQAGEYAAFENVMRLAKDIGPELPRRVKPDGSSIEEAVSLRRLPPNSI